MSTIKQQTSVREANVDNLDDLLGTGAESVMLPGEKKEPEKKTFFSSPSDNLSFLDNNEEEEEEEEEDPNADPDNPNPTPNPDPNADPLKADPKNPVVIAQPGDDPDPDKKKSGRPTTMITAVKSLMEKKILVPFDDEKKIEEYTAGDIEELIEANVSHIQEKLEAEMPKRFFSGMPVEMQQMYQYIANGGTDVKGFIKAVASAQDLQEITIDSEVGQASAVRTYLQATNYGTPDEIEDEINSLKDRNELEKKAKQFKPKLDAMSQEIVNQRLEAQKNAQAKRQEQSQLYAESVYNALSAGELNGIKLDSKTQNLLYAGLIQPNYQSARGGQTNLFGHLLEKYQYIEPNHALMAEALWLLKDPDGYREQIRTQGANIQNEKTVRKLKQEQQTLKSGGAHQEDDDDNASGVRKDKLQRPKKNFFAK